jgi:hypothetical protein
MKSSRVFALVVAAALYTSASWAAHVDMTDPKRALGREDDIRIDAQLFDDSVASNAPINVVYQVHNLTQKFIAIADKVCTSAYDPDARTIVVSIGAEVPADTTMPHLVTIAPGEKKVFKAAAVARVLTPSVRSPFLSVPRYVQIKVNVLRDASPFEPLIAQQTLTPQRPVPLANDLFDRWLDTNDAIDLNAIPVVWTGRAPSAVTGADQAGPSGGF